MDRMYVCMYVCVYVHMVNIFRNIVFPGDPVPVARGGSRKNMRVTCVRMYTYMST